jgi:hypothetical protein
MRPFCSPGGNSSRAGCGRGGWVTLKLDQLRNEWQLTQLTQPDRATTIKGAMLTNYSAVEVRRADGLRVRGSPFPTWPRPRRPAAPSSRGLLSSKASLRPTSTFFAKAKVAAKPFDFFPWHGLESQQNTLTRFSVGAKFSVFSFAPEIVFRSFAREKKKTLQILVGQERGTRSTTPKKRRFLFCCSFFRRRMSSTSGEA